MTAQEKAADLIKQFAFVNLDRYSLYDIETLNLDLNQERLIAKKAAIVAVDEILAVYELLKKQCIEVVGFNFNPTMEYWREVKIRLQMD